MTLPIAEIALRSWLTSLLEMLGELRNSTSTHNQSGRIVCPYCGRVQHEDGTSCKLVRMEIALRGMLEREK